MPPFYAKLLGFVYHGLPLGAAFTIYFSDAGSDLHAPLFMAVHYPDVKKMLPKKLFNYNLIEMKKSNYMSLIEIGEKLRKGNSFYVECESESSFLKKRQDVLTVAKANGLNLTTRREGDRAFHVVFVK